jgi:amino acid adenylation domain-containing protein
MSSVPERIAALSPEKREFLLRQLKKIEHQQDISRQGKGQERGQAPFLLRAYDRSGTGGTCRNCGLPLPTCTCAVPVMQFPLSFAQERLWFLDQLAPNSAWYVLSQTFRISGPLQVKALERSLAAVVQRHAVLRTTFATHFQYPRAGRERTLTPAAPLEEKYTHQILMSQVEMHQEEQPVQVIAPNLTIHIPVIDLSDRSAAERDQQVRQLARADALCPFDLACGPLLRVRLLRTGKSPVPTALQEHVLLLTLHHIVTDGWSMGVLISEMITFYQAEMDREPAGQAQGTVPTLPGGVPTLPGDVPTLPGDVPTLPELPIQYVDYALWQRQWLQGEVLEGQLAYWRKQLAGLLPLELPTDHRRPKVQTDRGASQARLLSQALSAELLRLCQKLDVSLFMLLLGSFQVLLMRYTGRTDVSVGTPIANRTRPELEGLIGFFLNTLVLRTDLSGNPTFEQVLRRVREVCLGAYAHQDIPFEKVVAELHPGRDLSHSPLFNVMLVMQNFLHKQAERNLTELSVVPLVIENATSKFDLTLYLTETEQGMHCVLEYSTDLFETDTITRMLDHWHTLLQGILQDSQTRVSDLPLLSPAEREQMLVTWNATKTGGAVGTVPRACPPLQGVCVHQLFEQQVEQTPESIAVAFGEGQQVTYQQINDQANQLAHRLLEEGIGPDRLVGVCMERSLELVGALLAVLKAGGAYVPLDPELPQERFTFLLEDAQVTLLLTQTHLRDRLAAPTLKTICVESGISLARFKSRNNPLHWVQPDNLAYVIYTSGSTGKPKGAMNTHDGLRNRLLWMQDTYQLTKKDRVLQKTPFSFDVSVWEFFWPLTTGACLIVARPEGHRDPSYLKRLIAERQVTTLHFVPSMLEAFLWDEPTGDKSLEKSWAEKGTSLRQVICSGEALTASLQARFFAQVPEEVQLHNLYGPTEAAIDVTFWPCQREQRDSGVPIGRPIANTQIYLLDGNLQPVPIGVTGELYIGGVGLARGYAKRPERTAERFIPNPFAGTSPDNIGTGPCAWPEPGARLYRTGDLARYLPNGTIEYLGRIDHQVKMRGYRIELGEIEETLRAYPGVQEAVVVLHEESEARQYLVAYVVARTGESLTAVGAGQTQVGRDKPQPLHATLRGHLREQLPDYMVPTHVIELPTLPLTPNGKVDRVALGLAPRVDSGEASQKLGQVAPYTPLQELLASIWKDVLHLSEISIHDSFFELGGHSLLATQVVSRIRRAVQIELPLRVLFQGPTIAELAQQVETRIRGRQGQATGVRSESLPALVPNAHSAACALSFAQERLWFLHQLEPASALYNMASALRLTGQLHVHALERSIALMVQRHEVLRTTFALRQDQPVQIIAPSLAIQIAVIDLLGIDNSKLEGLVVQLARAEAQRSFDLTHGPLLRVYLLRTGAVGIVQTCGTRPQATADPVPTDEQEHVLLFTLHHIITDGWSMEVLVREMTTLYQAQLNGDVPTLPELPIQYADYAIWQRQWLQGAESEAQLAHWRRQLADLSPLELPTDYRRPAVKTDRGASQSRLLPATLSAELLRLCLRLDVTLFMLLLGSFQVLLMRYTGQTDISVGTPIANRTRAELEGLIGLFLNTLVLRTDLSGNPTFEQVLQRVREVCLGAYANPDIPFEKVVEVLAQGTGPTPGRDLSHSPLFNVMVIMQNFLHEQAERNLTELSVVPLAIENATSKFDLTFYLNETEQGLSCAVSYNTDLFVAETISRLLSHWQTLLEGIVHSPQIHVWELPLLTAEERAQILVEWNATTCRDRGFSRPSRTFGQGRPLSALQDLCIHQLFEQQVERTPEAIALAFGDDVGTVPCACPGLNPHLTYRDLDTRANQLAHYLHSCGVGPEVLVGVCLERSPEMVVALLGILKAGGAYVPLDPTYPESRLAFMIQDSQIKLLLTQSHLQARLEASSLPIFCLDRSQSELALCPTTRLESLVQPDHLAYMIYTSGSTGTPKGVLIPHRGVISYLSYLTTTYPLDGARVLQLPSISFDPSVRDIFGPLVSGGSMILLPPSEAKDPLAIARTMRTYAITSILSIVPSMLRELQRVMTETNLSCPTLHTILVSGEALHLADIREVQAHFAEQAVVINQYGPTECTMVSNCYTVESPAHESKEHLPIGRPIFNKAVYILDAYGNPVPVGVSGELHIGGKLLARGYLNQPELTAERFIPNPYVMTEPWDSPQGGERLYKTGDLARYLPDGNIEFLGRIDQQVKIRGYRIELGEIEGVLRQHEAVQACVILDREDVTYDFPTPPPGGISEVGDRHVGTGVSLAYHTPQENEKSLSAPAHHARSDNLPPKYLPMRAPGGEKRLVAYVVVKQGDNGVDGGAGDRKGRDGTDQTPNDRKGRDGTNLSSTHLCGGDGPRCVDEGLGPSRPLRSSDAFRRSSGALQRELRTYLQERLPAYMLPSAFVLLDALPLTPNGKIDKRALPEPEVSQGERDRISEESRTPIEDLLVGLWCEVLHNRRDSSLPLSVGIHENFFELGGHSLLATRLVARVRAVLGLEMPLRAVFEAPTVAEFAKLVEQALHSYSSIEIPPLVAVARLEEIPLSFGQQRLWFLDQLDQGSTAYLYSRALRMLGHVHAQALEQSLQELVQRHESLRTTFEMRAVQAVQVIHQTCGFVLPVIDLQGLRPERREGEVQWLAEQEAQSPMCLVTGPLLRTFLLRMAGQEQVLFLTLHHIITDGWSNTVLMREMTTLYQSKVAGQPSPLTPLPIQYADYALWQRRFLQGDGSAVACGLAPQVCAIPTAQMAYWRKQLAGVPPIALPTDHPRKARQTYRGARQSLLLSEAVSDGLRTLSRAEHVTLFMLLLAAFQVLLARLSNQEDIAVGTPIANRRHAELEGLIGFFVNTLVMRTDLSGNPSFVELLTRVRKVCLEAYTHQDIPFEKVVEELEPERDLSRSPLFQVLFQLQNAVEEEPAPLRGREASVHVKPLALESKTSKFDLTLSIVETAPRLAPGGLHMALEYSTDLFEADTITRLLANFQVLLEGIVQNPQAKIADLPLLTAAERERLLVEWNTTNVGTVPLACPPLQDVCVHQLFEQQSEQTPDTVALAFGYDGQQVTYQQLNDQANHLAYRLQEIGIGPEVRVGIYMERSLELVVALLAVLKAGGAYVPLDPNYPQERFTWTLEDCQISLLLTQQRFITAWSRLPVQVILLDTSSTDIEQEPKENPESLTSADNLISVIYTSGSTGRPKGVLVTHRATLNRLHWMWECFPFEAAEICCQKTSLSFVDSVWELFGPLLRGIKLVLIADSVLKDPQQLISTLRRELITRIVLVPSLLRLLLNTQSDLSDQLPHLKYWTSSGEALLVDLAASFLNQLPQRVFLNLYGSSEVAADATCYDMRDWKDLSCVPIGRPIANTQIYLLDRNLQPVPMEIPGELYIGGEGLARGYWRRPELTAERFIPNPFVGTGPSPVRQGARLYRTGDLARYRGDGTIEYLGRIDQQVKLRGFRIEPGEIEATLLRHPAIQACVVLVREELPGEKRLVAYCVVHQGSAQGTGQEPTLSAPTVPALCTYLQDRLPAYMLPATFVLLDNLPLMPNGKVDRHALATKAVLAQGTGPIGNKAMVTPRTHIEKALAAIWTDLLHLEQVSISDNFFALGGHSLLAVQLLNRMNKQFGLSLSLAMLFQVPTIEQAAALLQKEVIPEEPCTPEELRTPVAQGTGSEPRTGQGPALSAPTAGTSSYVPIQPVGEKRPFFWVHPGHGDVYCYLDLAKHLRHDRPFYGIQAPGLRSQCDCPTVNGVDELTPQVFNSVEEMATSYIDEILAIQPDGPYFLGGYSFGGLVAFEMARQLEARGCSVALLALVDSYPSEHDASPVPTNPLSTMKDYTEPMMRSIERLGWKEKVSLSYEVLCRLQPDEQLAYVLDRLREAQVVPDDMGIRQLRRHIQVREAHDSHRRNYRPKPYAGRITLFRSEVAEEDSSLWIPFSAEPVEVHTVSGEHNSMVYEPYAAPLAAQLQQCLDKADRT